jgi:asparagine synthase (glutamine-hydrolysing)
MGHVENHHGSGVDPRLPGSGFYGLLRRPASGSSLELPGLPQPLIPSLDGALHCAAWDTAKRHASQAFDGSLAVAVHGEVLNAADLRRELTLPPHTSLAHTLLAGWRRWSAALLERLDGVHALALRDGDQLLLHRDDSGLRDLHCHVTAERIAFATHLDLLLTLPGVERRMARRSLHEYLRLLDIAAPNALYEDVLAVEDGQTLCCRAGDAVAHPAAVRTAAGATLADFETAVDMLDAHLQRSVRVRLSDSAVPAAFLSGGVDSALLCAIAARQRPDLKAVTVGFDGPDYDETPVARRIAAHLGIEHEVMRFDRTECLRAMTRLGATTDQPMADPSAPASLLAFEKCRERFDVVLDGTGADEAVGLMPPRHARVAVAWTSRLPRPLRMSLAALVRSLPQLRAFDKLFEFDHGADLLTRWSGFRAREIEVLCREPVSFAHTRFWQVFARYPRGAHFDRYSALLDAMPCGRLNQAMLASGATVRFPFWDAATNRLLRQLRTDFRGLPGQPKRILRALLARYVPPDIWDSPKRGFTFPLESFLAGDGHALVRHHLDGRLWQRRQLVAADCVEALGRRFMAGERDLMFRVWALVVLSVWLEGHGEPRM